MRPIGDQYVWLQIHPRLTCPIGDSLETDLPDFRPTYQIGETCMPDSRPIIIHNLTSESVHYSMMNTICISINYIKKQNVNVATTRKVTFITSGPLETWLESSAVLRWPVGLCRAWDSNYFLFLYLVDLCTRILPCKYIHSTFVSRLLFLSTIYVICIFSSSSIYLYSYPYIII